ncbi:MAG: sialate O-acetylesterase [Verrucomicrobiae bacterium]|nr:sialate O-acetylesterase [Verrucomicrobiae bacterium]NNJ85660.1 hypothetical protein [Akkermansiaceae bacterium]
MKNTYILLTLIAVALAPLATTAEALKAHGIFSSNMVLQRDKPITIWGWAKPGNQVSVKLGSEAKDTTADNKEGRWQAEFPAREASGDPLKLVIQSGADTITMEDILIGDIWVMFGQSNMAFGLGKTHQADMEILQGNQPLLRQCRISSNEQATLQTDIPARALANDGWVVADPKTVAGFSAIGHAFASRVQRALGIPIGIIDNARGGASLESLVPRHKFDDHPIAKRYADSVDKRIADFDPDEKLAGKIAGWERKCAQLRKKGTPENKMPPKPTRASLRSWDIPGKSPSDAASCYNGMFGVFKGLGIKGVLFHQGYNNAMSSNCRPKRYRVLMKLMIEGFREDFKDPELPVGVIGFCAGGIPQTDDNFEVWSTGGAPYIREAQRLGAMDVNDPDKVVFLPAYDIQIPGLHPHKKQPHGLRAARWALNKVYDARVNWSTASLKKAEPHGDEMVLTFDQKVMPDDMSTIPEGFSIAGEDGKFYRAHARFLMKKDAGIWNTAHKSYDATVIHVWSPLVEKPLAVRYAWATSPMGNLKANGRSWAPLASFRTDRWDYPESEDPTVSAVDRSANRAMNAEATIRLETRKLEEAKKALEILERLKTLGVPEAVAK